MRTSSPTADTVEPRAIGFDSELLEDIKKVHSLLVLLTPGSPGKFLMAAFVRPYAQKMTARICPVQLIVMSSRQPALIYH
jgi:hypothetical protein